MMLHVPPRLRLPFARRVGEHQRMHAGEAETEPEAAELHPCDAPPLPPSAAATLAVLSCSAHSSAPQPMENKKTQTA